MAGIKLKQDLFDGVFADGSNEVIFSREKRQELVNSLRKLMGEEPSLPVVAEPLPAEELAEDTPYFRNPEILADHLDFAAEEGEALEVGEPLEVAEPLSVAAPEACEAPIEQSAQTMEDVLNQGMGFLSGLLEIATGQKLTAAEGSPKMVHLDQKTGEVTLKFTLPGFAQKSDPRTRADKRGP